MVGAHFSVEEGKGSCNEGLEENPAWQQTTDPKATDTFGR